MPDLADALSQSREMIEEALTGARAELETLRLRQTELEEQIAQAEAAIGKGAAEVEGPPRMTLHEALAQVLRDTGDQWLTVRELTKAVNDRELYRKRDGSPVEINQVHARTTNYPAVFEKDGANVRLRKESPMLAALPPTLELFRDNDSGFFDWLDNNTDGFFINTERSPNPNYLVLHVVGGCGHFKGAPSAHWTKDYVKLCSSNRDALESWAEETVGGEVTLCRDCFDIARAT
jgi:hypothetical protein